MKLLRRIADQIAAARDLSLDRMARRTKDGILCWLCENAPELAIGIPPSCLIVASTSTAPQPEALPQMSVAQVNQPEQKTLEEDEFWLHEFEFE
jgi:hypothetical protein